MDGSGNVYIVDTSPDTVVPLPSIAGFKPNNNQDPQISDANGAYGFMVFPATDYYIVATKAGYNQYTSPTIAVEQEIVKWDFKMNPTTSGVTRLAGPTRVDTALAIAKASYPGKVDNVILATEDNYPDALAGSVYEANHNAPIILADGSLSDQVMNYLQAKKLTGASLFGGEAVVGQGIEQQLEKVIGQ